MNLEKHLGEQLTAKEAILHMFDGKRVIAKNLGPDDGYSLHSRSEDLGFVDVTANHPVMISGRSGCWEFEPERDASDIVCCRGPISYDDALKLSRMEEEDFKTSLFHAYASGEVRTLDGLLHWCEGN
jgi:hypothetical protein